MHSEGNEKWHLHHALQVLRVDGRDPGNPYLERIVKTMQFIGPSHKDSDMLKQTNCEHPSPSDELLFVIFTTYM